MRPGPTRSVPPLPANRESPLRRQAWELTWGDYYSSRGLLSSDRYMENGEPFRLAVRVGTVGFDPSGPQGRRPRLARRVERGRVAAEAQPATPCKVIRGAII